MKYELSILLFFAVLAVIAFTVSLGFPLPVNQFDVGSGAFPRILTFVLIILCLLQFILIIKKKVKVSNALVSKQVVLAIFLVFLYLFTIGRVNYFYSTPIFVTVFGWYIGMKNIKFLVPLAIGFTIFAYLVFYKILAVPLNL